MTGSLVIVGTGPGKPELMTPATQAALAAATDLVGYGPYLDRVPALRAGQCRHASDNRVELDRARHALALAASGRTRRGRVGRRSRRVRHGRGGVRGGRGGRSGVARARHPGRARRDGDAGGGGRVGAPLGGDFCAISLSDNLKSWATIERRLKAAAEADFVIALYNPASKARPHQLGEAFALLRTVKAGETPVLFVRAAGSAEAKVDRHDTRRRRRELADMRTLVIVGASTTRQVGRWIYTPRGARP